VKVTPWVFIPWFAFRRQWRLLGALCATGAAWLAALAAWFGPARVQELFLTWFETSRARKLDLAEVAYFENQSIQGVLARLTRAFPALGERILGVPAHALAWAAATLLLLGVALASARRDRFRAALPPAELAFICLVMFLCSPDSRWAHQVQLLAPLTFLGALAARVELLARARDAVRPLARWRLAVGAVVVAGLLAQVVLTTDVIGKQAAVIVRLWASHFLFAVALTALVGAFLLVGRREPSAPTSSEDDPLGIRAALPRAGIG
jgi:hypothetical protein